MMRGFSKIKFDKVLQVAKNPYTLYSYLADKPVTQIVPDSLHLSILFRAKIGCWPNLRNPKSFNEKLQWLKLHDRNPNYINLVDKLRVKEWVANMVGAQFVPETYMSWSNAEEINVNALPSRFVLKTNNDSGGVVVCDDKDTFDVSRAIKKLNKHLKRNYFWGRREWPYKDIVPCVFAEENLSRGDSELVDYKFLCFSGEPQCLFTCTGRSRNDLKVDFFDLEWNHLPFIRHYPNADTSISKPVQLSTMIELSRILSAGIPFVRVDFYEISGRVYFGEMTFYPGSGLEEFIPVEWDYRLGSLMDLSSAFCFQGPR